MVIEVAPKQIQTSLRGAALGLRVGSITAAHENASAPLYSDFVVLLELIVESFPQHLELCFEICQASPQGVLLLGQLQCEKMLEAGTPLADALDQLPAANALKRCLGHLR